MNNQDREIGIGRWPGERVLSHQSNELTGSRVSAFERLKAMPASFSIEQMCLLMTLDKPTALQYASRWVKAGYLLSAGPRAGYYGNLVADPQIETSGLWRAQAVRHVYPSATVVGVTVLNACGWITQRPRETHVAVLAPANRSRIDGYSITPRPRRWYERVHEFAVSAEHSEFAGLRSLMPAMALADLYTQDSIWHPDEDDLDLDESDAEEIEAAFASLKAEMPQAVLEALNPGVRVERQGG